MTSRPRLLAAAGAVAVAALTLLPTPSAPAQGENPPPTVPDPSDPRWSGEQDHFRYILDPEVPEVINAREFRVQGYFEYTPPEWRPQSRLDRIELTLDPGRVMPEGCPLHFVTDVVDGGEDRQVAPFDYALASVCNAVYTVTLQAFAADSDVVPPVEPPEEEEEDPEPSVPDPPLDPVMSEPVVRENITLAVKPPEVGQVTAAYEDGIVALSWGAPVGYGPEEAPADFIGYRVLRALPDGEFETVDTDTGTPPRQVAFDNLPEGAVGEIRYQVQAARPLPDGTCCLGSDIGPTASTTVTIDTPVTNPPTTRRTSRSSGRRSTAPTRPAAPVVDEGFEETLDFDDFEPGFEEAVEPTGRNLLEAEDDDSAREGVLVPAATASVLAVWAMHLRYLSRRAGDAP